MKLGMKMRYNEPFMLGKFKPQMIELHLADEDLFVHWNEIIDAFSIMEKVPIIVHAPTNLYMKGDRRPLVDLASAYEKQVSESLRTLGKAIELAGEIDADYTVIHPGGQTPNEIGGGHGEGGVAGGIDRIRDPAVKRYKDQMMGRLLGSLAMLEEDYNTKEFLMENMPWHYWMWGGEERWYSNLLRFPEDFTPVLEYMNITLDICHAYLAIPEGSNDMIFDYFRKMGRYIKHVHLSDAVAPDGEGIQFGDGEIELKRVFRHLLDTDMTVIPEIREGHLNDREGMKEAVERFSSILLGRFKKEREPIPKNP